MRSWRMEAVPSCACQLHKLTNILLNSPVFVRKVRHSPQMACAVNQARNYLFVTEINALLIKLSFALSHFVCVIHFYVIHESLLMVVFGQCFDCSARMTLHKFLKSKNVTLVLWLFIALL